MFFVILFHFLPGVMIYILLNTTVKEAQFEVFSVRCPYASHARVILYQFYHRHFEVFSVRCPYASHARVILMFSLCAALMLHTYAY